MPTGQITVVLHRVAEGVWTVPNRLKAFGLDFSGKMTIVRLGNDRLWLHAPIPISDALAEELAALGEVAHLVAPNRYHHLYAGMAKERYPAAGLFGAPGLDVKRKDLHFDQMLEATPPSSWGDAFEVIPLQGAPAFQEVVFFHRPTHTLIATDLFMNVHHCEGTLSRLFYRVEGCYRRFSIPHSWRFMRKDRAAFAESARRIAALDIERVVMAHGESLEEGAQEHVHRALMRFVPEAVSSASVGGVRGKGLDR